jgi:dimethylglycine dehydrogenase
MDFGHELLQPDLDRIAPSLEVAFRHFPALAEAGIKRIVNGPFTFAPDGNPLIGPVPGLRNHYAAVGVMAGFSQGGGVGRSLAEWIIEGEPSMDVFAMDIARFGDFAGKAYTQGKVKENYSRRFQITFPNEELPAARPLRTTPVYDRLKAKNAVFGAAFGLEQALWFAPEGEDPYETPSFRRSNAFGPVGEECQAVRNGLGLMEISGFAKYEVTGPGAEAWLNRMLANHMPREGRLLLSPMLSPTGRLMGDFTIAKLGPERFFLFGSGIAEAFHLRWFREHLTKGDGVRFNSVSATRLGFAISGPRSRELLARLTWQDVSNAAFPFLSIREMEVGLAPALVARISFTGELGYEIYVRGDYQLALYEALLEAGEDLGLRLYGGRALNALRLEKGFGSWTREYTPDYSPDEAGMSRFVDLRKNDFVGRDAVMRAREAEPKQRLVILEVAAEDADAFGNEPVYSDGRIVGLTTSGGYGYTVGKSIALAYVEHALAVDGQDLQVDIVGERRQAKLLAAAPYDPKGERLRS